MQKRIIEESIIIHILIMFIIRNSYRNSIEKEQRKTKIAMTRIQITISAVDQRSKKIN